MHLIPDKVADRIAGAMVDIAYREQENPKVAVEVLLGHGKCLIITESSVEFDYEEVCSLVGKIAKNKLNVELLQNKQDIHLASNQESKTRCGDNGIFKGVPLTNEEKELSFIARQIYAINQSDGKYILDGNKLIVCQSNVESGHLQKYIEKCYNNFGGKEIIINPIGDWTGGTDVDSGATNRKLGSDMADSVTGGGLCLSGDTEYLSDDYKWHKFKDYKNGKVSQWNNFKLEFVEPIKYVHNKNSEFIRVYNNTKLDMKLTPDHQVLIKTSKNNLIKKPANEIAEKLEKGIGNSGSIIHNFTYSNESKCKLLINDLKLQVAFCADGSILKNGNKTWSGRIRVKKEYKKHALREILKDKLYKETQDNEYSIFWINPPILSKSLYDCFKDKSSNWVDLYNEIYNWDGNKEHKLFRTTIKEDADFIQFIVSSMGNVSTITIDNRIGEKKQKYTIKSICYIVHELKSKTTQLRKSKETPINVEHIKNLEDSYCFNVPSHNLIVRYNNKIFITGNCGKDLSKADVSVNIYAFLKAQETGKVVELCCAIGDDTIDGKPYSEIVEIARKYIQSVGGFEKFAEWGLY